MTIKDDSSLSSAESKRLDDIIRKINTILSSAAKPAHIAIAEVCRFEDQKDRVYYQITIEHEAKVTLSMREIGAIETELGKIGVSVDGFSSHDKNILDLWLVDKEQK
jgi:hypothetical protein